jgi:ABC-2 type transport system ATP-binding protein
MDEAERCGRVAYLYLSNLLAIGTPEELKRLPTVTPAGTRRLEIAGGDSAALLARLRHQTGVREATIFGQAVHALVDADRSLPELGLAGLTVRESEANLEDVFVTLSRLRKAS